MKTETQLLIDLIKQNKTLNEISNILGLSNKQVFIRLSMLKSSGYLFDKKYYYNGELKYSLHNPFIKNDDNTIYVTTSKDIKNIRIVLISDTHLGHENDEVECIHSITEYCINNNIHLVFNLGDFFEGIYHTKTNKCSNAEEQIAYSLKNYPCDKNILNFIVLGNHDSSFWLETGIDIKNILEERRHDIIPVGYGYGEINVGGCQFRLQHPLRKEQSQTISQSCTNKIILKGHSHKYSITPGNNNLSIKVPALSSVPTQNGTSPIPSMIDLSLEIKDNKIHSEYLQQFIFINDKPIRINEIQYYIPMNIDSPQYEEEIFKLTQYTKDESLSSQIQKTIIDTAKAIHTNQYQGMSQTEKFNARYANNTEKTLKNKFRN